MDDTSVLDNIERALSLALEAVDADKNRDYTSAYLRYKETITILEHEANRVPDQANPEVTSLARNYRKRVELLEQTIPSLAGLVKIQPQAQLSVVEFREESPQTAKPEQPPISPFFKPFWLMRLFTKSIQTGCHITPRLFVPKTVWLQAGAKINAMSQKSSSWEAINDSISKIKDISRDDFENLGKELDNFCLQLGEIQNNLAKVLSYISAFQTEDKPKEKGFGNALKKMGGQLAAFAKSRKANADDDVPAYVLELLELFESSQHLEKLLSFYNATYPTNPITIKLKQISQFYKNVVCTIIVHDLNDLLARYMHKCKESFFPK